MKRACLTFLSAGITYCFLSVCYALTFNPATGINGATVDPTAFAQFINNPTFPQMTVTGPTTFSQMTVTGPTTFSQMTVTGPITAAGGVSPNGVPPLFVSNVNLGPTSLSSVGMNTADVNGQLWITDIFIPVIETITKIAFLSGNTAMTDNVLVAIYDSAGKLLTSSALTGVILSGTNTFQVQTLLSAVTLNGPGTYYVAIQGNGTAGGAFQTLRSPNICHRTAVVAGTFGTVPASITLPTTYTEYQGPVVYVQ